MASDAGSAANILIIHFGQLGDVVLGLPAMRAVRDRFPAARITALTGKPAAEIVSLTKVADEVIAVDRVQLRDGNPVRSVNRILGLVKDVRRRRFDLVVDLHSLAETNLLGFLARIPHRLYANRENRSIGRLSNLRPEPPREDKSKHVSERYLDVLRPLGVVDPVRPVQLDIFQANRLVDGIDGSLGIFPGAGHPSRCWDLRNFAELAERLVRQGHSITVFLGPEELGLRSQIESSFSTGVTIVHGLSLEDFIRTVSRVALFICNDTGPMHLASLAGVPILLIMDERAPVTYLPLAKTLRTVRHTRLDRITVDEVAQAVNAMLATI